MKTEYTWIEYKNMMNEAGFKHDTLKSIHSIIVCNCIDDSQLLKLADIFTKLVKGK